MKIRRRDVFIISGVILTALLFIIALIIKGNIASIMFYIALFVALLTYIYYRLNLTPEEARAREERIKHEKYLRHKQKLERERVEERNVRGKELREIEENEAAKAKGWARGKKEYYHRQAVEKERREIENDPMSPFERAFFGRPKKRKL
ncbi:hypothetical protein J4230_02245 [Candidatus Woesearchaeota archaeon]|nr:hypothetical protein [Candidatus Woesearchaeota archaeon]